MTFQTELINLLRALSEEEKDFLLELAKQNNELFRATLLEALRLKVIAKTGNKRAWERWKKSQEENLTFFLKELEDEQSIERVRAKLQST